LVRLPESASCYSGLLCIGRNTVSSKRSYLRATDIAMASYDKLKRTHKKMQTALDDLESQMAS
jgi:prefoldin subunit 5